MADPQILETVSQLPHFRALSPELVDRVASTCRLRGYSAGETIFSQGEACRGFFAVQDGGVRVYRLSPDGREQVLHNLRAGQSFAEAALLNMGAYPAHAVATVSPTELIEFAGAPFLQLFREEPRLGAAMVGSLCMWLLGLVERIEELSVASAGARLARYLLKLPARGRGELEIELPMAKKELAGHLAIAPETLSRLLRRWQDQGIVRSRGRALTVLDSRVLVAIADREEG